MIGGAAAGEISPDLSQTNMPVVVELFSSQGCVSCPPALELFSQLADQPDLITLNWAVDYWDFLGWKDPNANPTYADRQAAYNRLLNSARRYTPQMIIQGMIEIVGSDREALESALAQVRSAPPEWVPVTISLEADGAILHLPQLAGPVPATITLVNYQFRKTEHISGGQNAGQTLKYRNIVTDTTALGTWTGKSMNIPINHALLTGGKVDADETAAVVLLQHAPTGRIIGAAKLGNGFSQTSADASQMSGF